MTANTNLIFDECSARVVREGEITHAYAWPRTGGHVWEIVDTRGGPERRNICYKGSTNTILTEDTPRATAMHIAALHGITASAVIED